MNFFALASFFYTVSNMDILDLIGQGQVKRYFRATRKMNVPNVVFSVQVKCPCYSEEWQIN